MIAGLQKASTTLSSAKGRQIAVEVVVPQATPDNMRQLRAAADEWDKLGDRLEAAGQLDQAVRAWFASDTVFKSAEVSGASSIHVLVAQDQLTGAILGAALYSPDGGRWWIHQFATSPENQPGAANADQIRGIGSTMLGVIADQVAADPGCVQVNLYALDDAAEAFWRNRGFHDGTQPLHMSCEETRALAAKVRAAGPDRPDMGEVAEAEDPKLTARTSRPRVKSKLLKYR